MDTLELFRNDNNVLRYQRDDLIFDDGDTGDHMYVIIEGRIEIIVADKVMLTAEQGDIFGEMALIENHPRSAQAIARSSCKLIAVDRKRFAELVQQNPKFSIYVMRILAERLRKMNDLLR